ncbi:MAG: 30S ribosomal protein S9 [Candidatus Diapherotrites archaeon]|nr:30S ribosomal protein S9 [Candidatus Diapherotrites archaeon]
MAEEIAKEKKKRRKKVKTGVNSKSKRKMATARATITAGKGSIKVNSRGIETIESKYLQEIAMEPLSLAPELAKTVDIDVKVEGGGFMGQAIASRAAIAKALLAFTKDEKLRKKFIAYDRLMVVDDPRRVESKKPLGKKARKKKQKSKR